MVEWKEEGGFHGDRFVTTNTKGTQIQNGVHVRILYRYIIYKGLKYTP